MNDEMNRRATKRTRAAQRGMTLIEIMIVIAIIGMLATGVTIGVMQTMKRSQADTARNDACAIRNYVMMYILQNPGKCPSIDDLKSGGYVDTKMRTTDPWDQPWNIECDGDAIEVYSAGPEGGDRIACEKKEGED